MPQNHFFCKFSKTSEKIAYLQKKYAEILNVARAVVTNVEKKVKSTFRIFFTSAKVAPGCKCGSRGNRENFWKAETYAAQGLFTTAQGERNFVQKEGRKSLI